MYEWTNLCVSYPCCGDASTILDGSVEHGFCVGAPFKCGSNANGASDSIWGSAKEKCNGEYYIELTYPLACKASRYGLAGFKYTNHAYSSHCYGYWHMPQNFALQYKDSSGAWQMADVQALTASGTTNPLGLCVTDTSDPDYPTWWRSPNGVFSDVSATELLADSYRLYIGNTVGAQSSLQLAEFELTWSA